jgi:hypothetical protein
LAVLNRYDFCLSFAVFESLALCDEVFTILPLASVALPPLVVFASVLGGADGALVPELVTGDVLGLRDANATSSSTVITLSPFASARVDCPSPSHSDSWSIMSPFLSCF